MCVSIYRYIYVYIILEWELLYIYQVSSARLEIKKTNNHIYWEKTQVSSPRLESTELNHMKNDVGLGSLGESHRWIYILFIGGGSAR